jgi:hypothetical protein
MGCSLVTIFEILHHVLIWSEDFWERELANCTSEKLLNILFF